MIKVKRNFKQILAILVLTMICLFSSILGIVTYTSADSTMLYSNVLDDLQKDKNFKVEDYPSNEKDYSIQIIQIAESENKELFIYTYQPCVTRKLIATSMNFSTKEEVNFHNYKLSYLNSNKTLYKYKVENFVVEDATTRQYAITSIFREWYPAIDDELDKTNENTIDEVVFEVAQQWTAETKEGKVLYTCRKIETIKVVDKYVGFIRYYEGWKFYDKSSDSHFVAFSTDRPIDRLMEAEVEYVPVKRFHDNLGIQNTYEELDSVHVDLTDIDKVSTKHHGWFYKPHTWSRIESVQYFKSHEDLTKEGKVDVDGKDWILRFAETEYLNAIAGKAWTDVNEVTVLRLKFETDGDVYNLGVVDNKQTGDGVPDNISEHWWDKISAWFKSLASWVKVFVVIGLVLLACVPLALIIWVLVLIISAIIKSFKGNK